MTQAVEREVVWIGSHLSQAMLVPNIEFAAKDGAKVSIVTLGLEQGRVRGDIFVADQTPQNVNCAHRTQKWTRIIACERHLLDPFTVLYGLGKVELDEDTRNSVMLEPRNIAPADQSNLVYVVV